MPTFSSYKNGHINHAFVIEGGATTAGLPVWAHISAAVGESQLAYSMNTSFLRVRGGPELRTCNDVSCLVVGFDAGYQRQRMPELYDDGPTLGGRLATEVGTGGIRLHAAIAVDGYYRYGLYATYADPVSIPPDWTTSVTAVLGVTLQPSCSWRDW